MKAYAVRLDGCYWMVHAPTAAKAKGMVIATLDRSLARRVFASIRCRRWREIDTTTDVSRVVAWGIPGDRDWDTGIRITVPDPFVERER